MPKVIIHNTISLDGAIKGFAIDMGIHYGILMSFEPEVVLVGSETVRVAESNIPPEIAADKKKRKIKKGDTRPYWAIVDSKGILKDVLHYYRRMEYIKDIIMLVSEKTPKEYVQFLKEREYDIIIAGKDHVDLKKAFSELQKRFSAKTIVTDSGGTLVSVILTEKLADELSLIIAPTLTGNNQPTLFQKLLVEVNQKLLKTQQLENNYLHLQYKVLN